MRMLVIGDTHIPDRADRIPSSIEKFIAPCDLVVFTGDLTGKNVLEYFKKFGKVVAVRGNMDHLKLPDKEFFKAGKLKFGVIHGHGIYPRGDRKKLERIGLDMGVDVLITGHTHAHDVYMGNVLILNPGSATGVWGGGNASLIPSAMRVDVEGRNVIVRLCLDGEIEVFEFEL